MNLRRREGEAVVERPVAQIEVAEAVDEDAKIEAVLWEGARSDGAHAIQTKSCYFVLIRARDFTVHFGYAKLANLFGQRAKFNEHISGEHHEAADAHEALAVSDQHVRKLFKKMVDAYDAAGSKPSEEE